MKDPHHSTKLSASCTVEQYLALEGAKDKKAIADFIVERFEERYLNPVASASAKNGFAIMAVCCLMVESLESFRRGWEDTRSKSELAFCSFFSHWEAFADFRPVSGPFYKHVRCGILHQAETTGGWRIIRSGPIRSETTINAAKFSLTLRRVLRDYASSLQTEDWQSETWRAFRKKMAAICNNTKL